MSAPAKSKKADAAFELRKQLAGGGSGPQRKQDGIVVNVTAVARKREVEEAPREEKEAPKKEEELVSPEGEALPQANASEVKVSVDQVTRPGVMVSGQVVWSDGVLSQWYLDQSGQLGLDSEDPMYQPNQADINAFQTELRGLLGA